MTGFVWAAFLKAGSEPPTAAVGGARSVWSRIATVGFTDRKKNCTCDKFEAGDTRIQRCANELAVGKILAITEV